MGSSEQNEAMRRKLEKVRLQREQGSKDAEESRRQHALSEKKRKQGLTVILTVALLVALVGGGYGVYAWRFAPSPLDGFATCLAEKGAVMYGAIEWCAYTKEQAGMFGSAFRYLDYRDYKEDPKIRVTPTWKIGGEYYEKVQSLERISGLTGCQLPSGGSNVGESSSGGSNVVD